MKRLLALFLSLCLLLPLTACGQTSKFSKTVLGCFDTVTSIIGYEKTEDAFLTVASEIEAELREYHALFSIYDDSKTVNNLKRLNEERSMTASDALLDFLEYGILMYEKTNGRMNIAMGAVLSLWHEARTAGTLEPHKAKLPDREALEAARAHCSIDSIVIDREKKTVTLTDERVLLDVGALGKGYAVEMIAKDLEARGISGYLINAGGNVRTVGVKGDGSTWSVGVEDPNSDDGLLATLSLSGEALVTSGSYMRYYYVKGKKYHHIISPDTLMPSEGIVSLTVLSESSAEADALSTALFTLSYEDGAALLADFPEVEAMWLLSDGTLRYTDGFLNKAKPE